MGIYSGLLCQFFFLSQNMCCLLYPFVFLFILNSFSCPFQQFYQRFLTVFPLYSRILFNAAALTVCGWETKQRGFSYLFLSVYIPMYLSLCHSLTGPVAIIFNTFLIAEGRCNALKISGAVFCFWLFFCCCQTEVDVWVLSII